MRIHAMAGRTETPRHAARPPARRRARRPLRLLFALAAAVGFLAYLIPLGDGVLAAPVAHPLDRARAIRLARYLQADDHPTATRGNVAHLTVLTMAPAAPRLSHPVLVPSGRVDDPASPGWRASTDHRPDLSRSPPGPLSAP